MSRMSMVRKDKGSSWITQHGARKVRALQAGVADAFWFCAAECPCLLAGEADPAAKPSDSHGATYLLRLNCLSCVLIALFALARPIDK